jgi:hypothetical protein
VWSSTRLYQREFCLHQTHMAGSLLASRLEQLMPSCPLRVVRIPDFYPRRSARRLVGAVGPLCDDTFKIVLTRDVEEIAMPMRTDFIELLCLMGR